LVKSCIGTVSQHIIEGKIEGGVGMTEGQGRRHKQLLDDYKKWEDTGN
jgi:hypothetical protein